MENGINEIENNVYNELTDENQVNENNNMNNKNKENHSFSIILLTFILVVQLGIFIYFFIGLGEHLLGVGTRRNGNVTYCSIAACNEDYTKCIADLGNGSYWEGSCEPYLHDTEN